MKISFQEEEVALGINQTPCVSGLSLSQVNKNIGVSLGVSLSHQVDCYQIDRNAYELLLYRQRPLLQYLKDGMDELAEVMSLATLGFDLTYNYGFLPQFYTNYVAMQKAKEV